MINILSQMRKVIFFFYAAIFTVLRPHLRKNIDSDHLDDRTLTPCIYPENRNSCYVTEGHFFSKISSTEGSLSVNSLTSVLDWNRNTECYYASLQVSIALCVPHHTVAWLWTSPKKYCKGNEKFWRMMIDFMIWQVVKLHN